MHVARTIWIEATPDEIFDLVADVTRWPILLPHYRSVRVIGDDGRSQRIKMAAWRGLIPVSWTSLYEPDRGAHRLWFKHVRGVTRGMRVGWRLAAANGGADVTIEHDFMPPWPLISRPAAWFICRFFVQPIAGKTLRRFKALAEQRVMAFP